MRGSLWTLGGYGASQVIRLVSNLILARLLFPEAFGLMALVNVFMQGLEMLSDIGVGPSIVRSKRGADPIFLRTAWTIQVMRGLVLWMVACALAYPAAQFFGQTDPRAFQLMHVLPVAGVMALLGGFTSTAVYRLNRELEMRKLTALALVPQVITLAVSIAWALFDKSVWAIVAGGLVGSLTRLFMSHLFNAGPRDGFGWDREAARELGAFGRWVFLSTTVSFLASHVDRVMLGRLLSLGELGLYSIGMTFARVATQVAARLTQTVLYPLLSKYQDRPERLLAFGRRARTAVLWAGGAICAAFAIFAPTFFRLLYDERYAAAGPISQWLSIYIWAWILNATIDRIPLALGDSKALFKANCAGALGMALAWAGYRLAALPGFIIGMSAAQALAHAFLVRAIPQGRYDLARQSAVATIAAAAYAAPALALARRLQQGDAPPGLELFVVSALAAAPLAVAAWGIRNMMAVTAPTPEWIRLALEVSRRTAPMTVLRERGSDVLIARTVAQDGRSVIVKLWNRRGWRGFLRRISGTSIACREWDTLRKLHKTQIGVPEPLACFALRHPEARHTDVLIEEDLGECRDATEEFKAMLRAGDHARAAAFEQQIIDNTAVMVARRIVDPDHRLPNFVVRPDGRPVRLDFELARSVWKPALHRRALGLMIGTLLGSYVFAVQPDVARARDFAVRLQERLRLPPAVLKIAWRRVREMLERQKREIGLDTRMDWPW